MNRKLQSIAILPAAAAAVYFGWAKFSKADGPAKPAGDAGLVNVLAPNDPLFSAPPTTPTTPTSDAPSTAPVSKPTSVNAPVVAVSNAGTVEIHVNDADLVEVLRMLSLQSQKNIIASKDVHGTVTANLYDVTVREALDALLASNGYAYRERGNFIYIYTAKEMADQEKANRQMQTQTFRLYYTPAANAVTMVKPVLSTEAQVAFTTPAASGLDTGTKDIGGGTHATEDMLVVTDYADNLARVAKVLKEVDRRPQQILLEATILRATLTEDNALGIDFQLLGNVDFASLNAAGTNSGAALSGSITSAAGANGILDKGYSSAGTGFAGNVPGGGLQIGLVHNSVAIFLAALEQTTDTTIIANPKILALNKQKGEVIVGRKDGYTTSTTTDTSTTQTVEFLDTGTRLIFRPFIGDDGYIRMEIHPEDSSGGLTSANLPFKITTETTSNVMVKDGHTVIISGLFRESSQTSRAQVPGLGNIPGLGLLFRSQRDQTTREEIIILLTPHIIKDDEQFSAEAQAQMKEFEKLRIGVRKGMLPIGRERLAEVGYERAVRELNSPNPSLKLALFHLDAATNLNPQFKEAINLREQLTGRVISDVDNSSIRDFVRKQAMMDPTIGPATQPTIDASLFKPMPVAAGDRASATQPAISSAAPSLVAPTSRPSTAALDVSFR